MIIYLSFMNHSKERINASYDGIMVSWSIQSRQIFHLPSSYTLLTSSAGHDSIALRTMRSIETNVEER